MRRKDKEITILEDKLNIIDKCKVCRIGMIDKNKPYVIPMNYGYSYKEDKLCLYFHSALEGKKIDILKENNQVCFEIDCDHELVEGDIDCAYGYLFQSIIGEGKVNFLNNEEEKAEALNEIMKHQTGQNRDFHYVKKGLEKTAVFVLEAESFTGKGISGRMGKKENRE